MAQYKIAWLPGDGIGRDVMDAARIVLDAVRLDAEYLPGDIGWQFWCAEGDAFPSRTIELLKLVNAAMFGAITSKPAWAAEAELAPGLKGTGLVYRSPIVRMRQLFDLYVCLRPCKAYPGNPLNFKDTIDLVILRENTEDLYAGVEFNPVPAEVAAALAKASRPFAPSKDLPLDAYAVSCKINTRKGSSRIVRAAFEYAARHGLGHVTVVHKANVVRATDGLFLEEAKKVATEFPSIRMDDIISDLAAQMVGGLGFGCSGNIGAKLAVFEPSHGSAPKYAGQYKVNPLATILAAKMMLEWLGEARSAERLERAVAKVIRDGAARTYDMGGTSTTLEVAEAVARALPA
jgi:isocitrate dehydrogenase (NAD+)